jgi:hypothetical protein
MELAYTEISVDIAVVIFVKNYFGSLGRIGEWEQIGPLIVFKPPYRPPVTNDPYAFLIVFGNAVDDS